MERDIFNVAEQMYSHTMSEEEKVTPAEELVPDEDFTAEEHAEFTKLEAENPYKEQETETIRVPHRPEQVTATRHDIRFLVIFCIILAVVLAIILIKPFG